MANFYIDGLDRLQVDLATLAAMPDEDILEGMILPAAEILVAAMKEKAATTMNVITGSLLGSVKILTKGVSKGMAYAQVGPNQGKHPHASTGKRKRNAQGGGGGHYSGTNAEIAFIHEYGSSRTPAVHWMETAVTEHEDEILGTMEAGWAALVDKYFK